MHSASLRGTRNRVHFAAAASSVPRPMQSRLVFSPLAPLAACLCTLLACTTKDGEDTDASSSTAGPMTGASTSAEDTGTGSGTVGDVTSDSSSTAASTTETPTTGDSTDASATATSDASTTANTEASASESTGPAPTDGPGVLPGETGLEAFCRRYVECGGTYYDDAQACMDESLGYWGSCPSRRTALDNFGACMSEMACSDWSPDAYNPNDTPCAEQWSQVGASEPCD
jgi:hypothetical protein